MPTKQKDQETQAVEYTPGQVIVYRGREWRVEDVNKNGRPTRVTHAGQEMTFADKAEFDSWVALTPSP